MYTFPWKRVLLPVLIILAGSLMIYVAVRSGREQVVSAKIVRVSIGDAELQAELVTSPQAIQLGLGGRTQEELVGNGMLFAFPSEDYHTFWMKGMQFPLDFVWIQADTVVALTPDVQPPDPGSRDDQLEVLRPTLPVTHVLELPAGGIQRFGIEVGDSVQWQ